MDVSRLVKHITQPIAAPELDLSQTILRKLDSSGLGTEIQTKDLSQVKLLVSTAIDEAGLSPVTTKAIKGLVQTSLDSLLDLDNLRHASPLSGYTAAEVRLLQKAIEGKLNVEAAELDPVREYLQETFPEGRRVLTLLSVYFQKPDGPDLFAKAYYDQRIKDLGVLTLFPQVMAAERQNLSTSSASRNRGFGARIVDNKTQEAFYIKIYQTPSEGLISATAAKLGIGPEQLPSLDGFITEREVQGYRINNLPAELQTPEKFTLIGENLAKALKTLHKNGIVFNDTIVMDDFGHSHLIIAPDCSVKLIDFGNSLLLDQFVKDPIPEEFIFNYARSRPEFSFLLSFSSEEVIDARVRESLKTKSTSDIKAFDIGIVEEGLFFANQRDLSRTLLNALYQGFKNEIDLK